MFLGVLAGEKLSNLLFSILSNSGCDAFAVEAKPALAIDYSLQVIDSLTLKAEIKPKTRPLCIISFLLFHATAPIPDNINLLHQVCFNPFSLFMREQPSSTANTLFRQSPSDYKYKGIEINRSILRKDCFGILGAPALSCPLRLAGQKSRAICVYSCYWMILGGAGG